MLSISEDHGFRSLSRKCCQKQMWGGGTQGSHLESLLINELSLSLSVSVSGAIDDLRIISWNSPHLNFPVVLLLFRSLIICRPLLPHIAIGEGEHIRFFFLLLSLFFQAALFHFLSIFCFLLF